jgi:hypothetical protein
MEWGYTTSGLLFFVLSILILFAVSFYRYREAPNFHQNEQYVQLPKKIWTYHDTETPTPLQQLCYETWMIHHKDYEIVILTPKTYQGFVRIPERSSVPLWRDRQRWEEALCLYTLAEHGGLWLDSRTKLQGPVSHWLFPHYAECSVFYWKQHTHNTLQPFIDLRCVGANRDSLFIRRWKTEVARLTGYPSVAAYLSSLTTSTPISDFTFPAEWMASFSLQHVLHHQPYPMESIILHPIEDGPMAHYEDGRGDKKKAMEIGLRSKRPIVFLEEESSI